MTRVREAGSCAQALWDFAAAVGRQSLGDVSDEVARAAGIEQIAKVLGVGTHGVRNMLNPDRPEQISLERAGILQRAFGIDLLARWLAIEAGGTFIPLPTPTGNIERLTAKGVRAAAETAARVIEAQSTESDAGAAISVEEARALANDSRQVVQTFGEVANLADAALRKAQRIAAETKR